MLPIGFAEVYTTVFVTLTTLVWIGEIIGSMCMLYSNGYLIAGDDLRNC